MYTGWKYILMYSIIKFISQILGFKLLKLYPGYNVSTWKKVFLYVKEAYQFSLKYLNMLALEFTPVIAITLFNVVNKLVT